MKRLSIILFAFALVLVGCGDWGTDGSDHGYQAKIHFHYYYGQDCSWMGADYLCGDTYSLSPSLTVSVKVDWNGDATVYYDGYGPYYFWDGEYVYRYDRHYEEYYYQFDLDGNYSLTVYVSGAEVIYADTYTGVEHHYFYDVW